MKSVLLFALSFILCSCNISDNRVARAWIYHDWTIEEEGVYAKRYNRKPGIEYTSGNFIDLQPDGSFHSYLEEYTVGTWRLVKDSLTLTAQNNKRSRQFIVLDRKKDQLYLADEKKDRIYVFDGFANQFDSLSHNPFSPQNNLWRVKAEHKETDEQILDRLRNHFLFWEKYFAWALDKNIEVLSIQGIPSFLKMYGNGFQLEYYEYQPPEWKNLFYDTADSRKAYERMHYLMYEEDITWPKTENRFERFVAAFRQMQGWGKSEAIRR